MELSSLLIEARGGESNRDSRDLGGGRRRGLFTVVGVRIVRVYDCCGGGVIALLIEIVVS